MRLSLTRVSAISAAWSEETPSAAFAVIWLTLCLFSLVMLLGAVPYSNEAIWSKRTGPEVPITVRLSRSEIEEKESVKDTFTV